MRTGAVVSVGYKSRIVFVWWPGKPKQGTRYIHICTLRTLVKAKLVEDVKKPGLTREFALSDSAIVSDTS